MSDLEVITPVFLLIGSTFIAAYLAPVVLGKIDDWKKQENKEDYVSSSVPQ